MDIREMISQLAKSQGFYGRLLAHLDANPEMYEELEALGINDPVDLIMALEG